MDECPIAEVAVVTRALPRPRVWPLFLVFFGTIVLLIPVTIAFLTVTALVMHGPRGFPTNLQNVVQTDIGILGSALCTMIVFAAGAVIAAWLSPEAFVERLRLTRPLISPFGMAAAVCGTLAVSLAFDGLSQMNVLPESPVLDELSRVLGAMTGFSLIGAVLTIGIAPGIAEELLFRGYIQTRLTQRWGAGVGVVVTALLFGLMHMDLVHGAFAVVMGLFLGYLTERTGSIRPAMICHATNNIISTLTASSEDTTIGAAAPGLVFVAACLLLALSTAYLWAFVPVRASETSS